MREAVRKRNMHLKTHDCSDYGPLPGRPIYDWPNGTPLAVYIAVNIEYFAFGEGLGAELALGDSSPIS